MRFFKQIAAVTEINVLGLRQRLWSSLVIVLGMACVVGVLLSMLSFSAGLSRTILAAADPGRAIVLPAGAANELGQGIKRGAVVPVLDAPGLQKDTDGNTIASTEHLTNVPVLRKGDHLPVRMFLRGIGPKAVVLRPEFKLVEGRMFQPGKYEVIVGTAARAQFENLNVGQSVILPGGEWKIVGAFETGGDIIEGQLLTDVATIQAARTNVNGFGSIMVRLASPASFDQFKKAVMANPALNFDVERQTDFYRRTSGQFTTLFAGMAYLLGAIMAIGALFGTINIMNSVVSSRTREIATLRALGFGGASVAVSVLLEVLLLALTGALIGAAAAWLLFDGNRNSTGQIVFSLAVTPRLIVIGVIWATVIAVFGGVFPAIRAARLRVVTGLRAT